MFLPEKSRKAADVWGGGVILPQLWIFTNREIIKYQLIHNGNLATVKLKAF